jgi:hypothetical protein
MIKGIVRRALLSDFNLGAIPCPTAVSQLLRKGFELVYNEDDLRWELYKIKHHGGTLGDDILVHQMSCPVTGSTITPGISRWLEKFDSSAGGAKDDEQRQKDWQSTFNQCMENDKTRRKKLEDEIDYATEDAARYLSKVLDGQRQCVVPAGPPVGRNPKTGALIRPYKKLRKKRKEVFDHIRS